MNAPRISIAMATYNGAKYLREQLDSIAAQTLLPYELVICDDGSTDATLDIAEQFAAEAEFSVRIYRNETNLGYADNFLKAASLCEGDWVAFCDQDDVWISEKLAVVSTEISDNILMVVHSAKVVDDRLTPLGYCMPSFNEVAVGGILVNHPMKIYPGFACVFNINLVKQFSWIDRPQSYLGPRGKVSHDWWIYWLANVFGDIKYIPNVLVLYRRHDSVVSKPFAITRREKLLKVFQVGSNDYREAGYISENYSKYLQSICSEMTSEKSFICSRGAEIYMHIAFVNNLRAEIYENGSLVYRLLVIIKLIKNNIYFFEISPYRLGAKSMVKDVILAFGRCFYD